MTEEEEFVHMMPRSNQPANDLSNPKVLLGLYPTFLPYGCGVPEDSSRPTKVSLNQHIRYLLINTRNQYNSQVTADQEYRRSYNGTSEFSWGSTEPDSGDIHNRVALYFAEIDLGLDKILSQTIPETKGNSNLRFVMARLSNIIGTVKHADPIILIGGVNLVLFGDYMQYSPVFDRPLCYEYSSTMGNTSSGIKRPPSKQDIQQKSVRELILQINCAVIIEQQMRILDGTYQDLLERLRKGEETYEDWLLLQTRVA